MLSTSAQASKRENETRSAFYEMEVYKAQGLVDAVLENFASASWPTTLECALVALHREQKHNHRKREQ